MLHKYKDRLYHGTISEIEHIDVEEGRSRKDFGKGFYMAVSKKHATDMMHKKHREALRRNRNKTPQDFPENLYKIEINEELIDKYNIKCFEKADTEWLDFVLMCREKGGLPHDYDIVIGPTADDDTALCLKSYEEGLYGSKGSLEAKQILLKNLEVENLGVQVFIGKQKVADELITKIEKISWE